MSVLGRNKNERLREDILRQVFADNLRILGKPVRKTPYWRSRPFLSKVYLVLFLVSCIILGHFSYLDFPDEQLSHAGSTVRRNEKLPVNPSEIQEYSSFLAQSKVPISQIFDLKVHTIIIDPGHGGNDSGATGKMGIREKDITLDIARRLKEKLAKNTNYQIYMTREDDSTVPLKKRIEFANAHKADLYISIHVNYVPRKPINIIETYYFGQYLDYETLKLSEQENKDAQYNYGDFRQIVQKIGNTVKLQESKALATAIQKSLYKNIHKTDKKILDYGIKTAPFVVLLGVDVPSVLSEVSCLSNAAEEAKLNTAKHREEIADYIEEGIVNYLNSQTNKGDKLYGPKNL